MDLTWFINYSSSLVPLHWSSMLKEHKRVLLLLLLHWTLYFYLLKRENTRVLGVSSSGQTTHKVNGIKQRNKHQTNDTFVTNFWQLLFYSVFLGMRATRRAKCTRAKQRNSFANCDLRRRPPEDSHSSLVQSESLPLFLHFFQCLTRDRFVGKLISC